MAENQALTELTGIQKEIFINVMTSHFGGYDNKKVFYRRDVR